MVNTVQIAQKILPGHTRAIQGFFLLVCLLVLVSPAFLSGYWVRLLANVFMFGILAQGVNIIAGYCGYLSLGNILFFGLGAYVTAVLMPHFAFPFPVAFAASGAAAVLFSAGIGLLILRLK